MKARKLLRIYALLFLIAVPLIILDQFTKSYIRANFVPYTDTWAPWDWLIPYARIVHVHNTGVAFGMFQGLNYVFAALAALVVLGIIYYFRLIPLEDWLLRLALSLQLAGATGNLIDRLHQGYVTDFVSLGTFPVFNVADSCITVGVIVLLIGVWIQERREKAEKETAARLASVTDADLDGESPARDNNTSEA